MAHKRRRKNPSLKEILFKEPAKFEFHAAIKALERMGPEAKLLGTSYDPTKDPVEIKSNPLDSFPRTDISSLEEGAKNKPTLSINFLSLAGIQGPLPKPISTSIIYSKRHDDASASDFLDIFNYRLASIFHLIRKKYRIGISTESPEKTPMGFLLKSLLGLAHDPLDSRFPFPDRGLLFYSGLFWQEQKSVDGLERILSDFFKEKVIIEPFQGEWIKIPFDQRTIIGSSQKQYCKLGEDFSLGGRYWDQQAKFRVKIGPLSLRRYIEFLKPTKSFRELCSIVRYYIGDTLNFDINLILKKEQVPQMRLGKGVAVGWTSWIKIKDFKQDDEQAILMSTPYQRR